MGVKHVKSGFLIGAGWVLFWLGVLLHLLLRSSGLFLDTVHVFALLIQLGINDVHNLIQSTSFFCLTHDNGSPRVYSGHCGWRLNNLLRLVLVTIVLIELCVIF